VLFAAAQAGAAEPEWIDAALAQMQQSQAPVVDLLAQHSCHGCTDITGFGLLGHLGEMVAAAHQRCRPGALVLELDAGALPAFAGALPCLARGLASSLAPANQRSLALLEKQGPVRLLGPASPEQRALLVDPQTCGPLLAAVPAAGAASLLESLHRAGFAQACRIGSVHRRPH
jgi:selenide,water dikinase